MLRKFSGMFSRIASVLEEYAVRHPTHFPAVSSARDVLEGESGDEPQQGREAAENKHDSQP